LDKNVTKFVSTCVTCQKNKARCHKPYGLLQPLPVPEKPPWHTVTFDFIVKLPKTSRGNDSILVFVDKLTKMVHFVACKEKTSARELAELYVDHVFRVHGLSREFITDRDPRFTSAFWQGVTELLGTRTVMSSSFHPQSDSQTERVNQNLETYLRHCRAVPPRPCRGSIAVHDIRCTTAMPFNKGCLTEAILIPRMNHAANVSLDTKRIIT
jgi:hypothetical protein